MLQESNTNDIFLMDVNVLGYSDRRKTKSSSIPTDFDEDFPQSSGMKHSHSETFNRTCSSPQQRRTTLEYQTSKESLCEERFEEDIFLYSDAQKTFQDIRQASNFQNVNPVQREGKSLTDREQLFLFINIVLLFVCFNLVVSCVTLTAKESFRQACLINVLLFMVVLIYMLFKK